MLKRVANKLPILFLFSSAVLLAFCNTAEAIDTASDTGNFSTQETEDKPSSELKVAQSKDPIQKQSLEPISLVKDSFRKFLRSQNFAPMISTDRNSVTPHPNAVPLGYIQVESGTTFSKFNSGGDIVTPETVIRLGTWTDGELRLQVPNYVTASGTPGNFRGTTDIQVSLKQDLEHHWFSERGWDLGTIVGMTVPTGSLSNGRVDPFVQTILFKRKGMFTLGTSHSIFMPSEIPDDSALEVGAGRTLTYQPTVILFRHIKLKPDQLEKADVWIEWAGLFPENRKSIQIIDIGAVYRPVQRHQLDFRIGFGLTRESPRAILGIGYSWLPGKVIPFYKRKPEHIYRP